MKHPTAPLKQRQTIAPNSPDVIDVESGVDRQNRNAGFRHQTSDKIFVAVLFAHDGSSDGFDDLFFIADVLDLHSGTD